MQLIQHQDIRRLGITSRSQPSSQPPGCASRLMPIEDPLGSLPRHLSSPAPREPPDPLRELLNTGIAVPLNCLGKGLPAIGDE